MIVCPVCENQQQAGTECDVCGKDLSGAGAAKAPPVPVQPVEGLEGTFAPKIGEVPLERFAELEVNTFAKVAAVPIVATPDLETRASVGEVPVERVADLEQDRAPDDGVRTAAPSGQVVCRYCKNVQPPGTVCNRCGMKLPTALQTDASVKTADLVRCVACGAPGVPGERCKECGRPVAPPEA